MKQWIAKTGLAGMLAVLAACGSSVGVQTPQVESQPEAGLVGAMAAADLDFTVRTSWPGFAGDTAKAIALQTDGKVVVAGSTDSQVAIVRYNSNGTLDTTFSANGVNGKLKTTVGITSARASAVAVQSDGKILAAGYCYGTGTSKDFMLVRYNANGTLDTSFDGPPNMPGYPGNGKICFPVTNSVDEISAMAIQSNGDIVVAGVGNFGQNKVVVARFLAINGALDLNFSTVGTNGIARASVVNGVSADDADAVVIQSDGKIVIAGNSVFGGVRSLLLMRFTSLGVLDTAASFGGANTGIYTSSIMSFASAMTQQTDGKLVVVGPVYNGSEDFGVARFDTNGVLDPTFGGSGVVSASLGSFNDRPEAVALQSNGKIVVVGSSATGIAGVLSRPDFGIVRYNTDGTLDTGFSGDGKLTTAVGPDEDIAYGVVTNTSNQIFVAGHSWATATNFDFILNRYQQ